MFRFVSDHQADYPIATMCRLLGVSSSGYHAWEKRRPSRRSQTDAALITEIRAAQAASRGTYGAPRIHAELAAKGTRIGRKRVARLMSQAGLAGVSRRRFVKGNSRQAPDLVERNFTTKRPICYGSSTSVCRGKRRERWGDGPPQSACRSRLQTTVSGAGQKPGS